MDNTPKTTPNGTWQAKSHRVETLRIGAVNYLNTKPLVYGLQTRLPDAKISFELPSRLAAQLADEQLDVALVPSITLADNPQWSIVSDACIGCRGPVLSVKVMFRVAPEEVRTLALDEGSRTSAILVQILLHQLYGIRPSLHPLPIGTQPNTSEADAILVIGDRAIFNDDSQFAEVWDLGDRWCRWAELPFVFAMWVARPGVDTTEVAAALSAARDDGCQNLQAIAAEQSQAMGLGEVLVYEYLHRNLYFYLDEQQRRGLDLFYREAAALNLIDSPPSVIFDDCPTKTS